MLKALEDRFTTRFQSFDGWLLLSTLSLLLIGWVMVTSASTEIAASLTGNPYYFSIRHGVFVVAAIAVGLVAVRMPLNWWRDKGPFMLIVALLLLFLVLLVGREVNGSRRWIPLGLINVQASEVAKLCLIVYLSGYLERFLADVRRTWSAFLRPLAVLALIGFLLILEPDYGAIVVLTGCVMGMLLLAGAPLWRFLLILVVVGSGAVMLAVAEPYRLQRITSFANPWADQYNTGYQLTQALIAFGRGHWFGLGLGNSVQKLFYLPEAHTDFVFAVLAEELGLFGAVSVILLFALLVFRAFRIGRKAELAGSPFAAYLCYGIALVIGAQAFINISVSSGMLPTKGLTLPLLSYGGSSMIVSGIMVALLFRVDAEVRRRLKLRADAAEQQRQPRQNPMEGAS